MRASKVNNTLNKWDENKKKNQNKKRRMYADKGTYKLLKGSW